MSTVRRRFVKFIAALTLTTAIIGFATLLTLSINGQLYSAMFDFGSRLVALVFR